MGKLILYSHGGTSEDIVTHNELINLTNGKMDRIAYLPSTPEAKRFFEETRNRYRELGVKYVEYCDIHSGFDDSKLVDLLSYDAIHLSAGDPIYFNACLKSHKIDNALRKYYLDGGVLIGNSGGSMQLTRNVSLYRLVSNGLSQAKDEYMNYFATGLLDFEFLPHYNWHNERTIELVKEYTHVMNVTVYSCADGGSIISEDNKLKFTGETYLIHNGSIDKV